MTLVAQAFKSALHRRVTEITEWFKVPEEDRLHSLTVLEVIQAVEQRFWPDISRQSIVIDRTNGLIEERVVPPHHIRPLYDLLSEAVRNTLKHSNLPRGRLRLQRSFTSGSGLVSISSSCAAGPESSVQILGHPYQSLNEALFDEGRSGLEKIAYLSAYLTGLRTEISVVRKEHSFHIVVPVSVFGDRPEENTP